MKEFFLSCLVILSITSCYSQNDSNKKLSRKQLEQQYLEKQKQMRQKDWEDYLVKVEESKALKAQKDSIAKLSPALNKNPELPNCDKPDFIPPKFPNCVSEFNLSDAECFNKGVQNHVKRYFSYPEFAMEHNIQGKVFISYDINEEGNIEIRDVRGPENGLILEEEVVKFMSKLPKLTPAYQCDKPVRISFSMPITFRLD
jgi:TonB family protein